MKYGICTNMNARDAFGIGIDMLPLYRQVGFDYVELPLAEIMKAGAAQRKIVMEQLEECGIPCESCNNFYPADIKLTGERFNRRQFEAYTKEALNAAQSLGAGVVVFGSGEARNAEPPCTIAEAKAQYIERLGFIAAAARDRGITIAMENINRGDCNVINRFSEVADICRQLGLPTVRCIFDNFHFAFTGETLEYLSANVDCIAHVHLCNPLKRRPPLSELEDDYRGILRALAEGGYDARISFEVYTNDMVFELTESLAFIRRLV
jgi:sugar phosphate isomerase/epimerase